MACPTNPKEDNLDRGMCALDAILCFGYRIIPNPPLLSVSQYTYRLCSKDADWEYKASIDLLVEEMKEGIHYYAEKILEKGREGI